MSAKRIDLSAGSGPVSGRNLKIAIVVSEWNSEITESLFQGAIQTLLQSGCRKSDISRVNVPGSYELPSAADLVLGTMKVDAVICLGCVIQGETRHFEFICQAVAQGLIDVSLEHKKPVVFGVLTTNTWQQAIARAGGRHGNKGVEAANTALRMAALFRAQSKRLRRRS